MEGSGGLEIALLAWDLQQAGHGANGDRKSSGLSDIVSYDCLFGKRKPSREPWCPSPPPEGEIQLAHVLPPSPTCPWSTCMHTHTGTRPLISCCTTPNPVYADEVSSPHSSRPNRAPEPCLYFYSDLAARDSVFQCLLGKS